MSRVQVVHDDGAGVPNQIAAYIHCSKCLAERPPGVSPAEWARTQAGLTRDGAVQVWCNRHDCNVTLMTARAVEGEGDEGA